MAVEIITSTSPLLNHIRASEIWHQIISINSYTAAIPQILKIKQHNKSSSEWHLVLDGIPFSWIQRDFHDEKKFISCFAQEDGDFEHFKGCWKIVKNVNNSLKIHFEIEYSFGLPAVEDTKSNVCKMMLQNYADALVSWHFKKCVGLCKETRSIIRYPVNDKREILVGKVPAEVHVVNISRHGIMFSIKNIMSHIPPSAIADITIGKQQVFGNFYTDPFYSTMRMVFRKELTDEELCSILSLWHLHPNRELLTVFDVLTSDGNHVSSEKSKVHHN
jgi:ribosome-associated toxin RatA of RatAB toxin-antitoxin module